MPVIIKTYKYRLYPTPAQDRKLFRQMRVVRHFYNMCLDWRKNAYNVHGEKVSQDDTEKTVTHYKRTFRYVAAEINSQSFKTATRRLDAAYEAFFKRGAGYPRFKSRKTFNSIGLGLENGARIRGKRLYIKGISGIKIYFDRPLPPDLPDSAKKPSARVRYHAGRWYLTTPRRVYCKTLPETGREIGIDMGIAKLFTLSDGTAIDNPRWYPEAQAKLRRLQRRYQRAQKGSNNQRRRLQEVKRFQEHIANKRKDFINKVVHTLIRRYDMIAIEDLKITNMVRNKYLAKHILNAGWGYFKIRLQQKAAETGREIIMVDPAYTSKTCSQCGKIFHELTLADRWVRCDCGMSLDRDHNAAVNILNRARTVRSGRKQSA